MSCGSVEYRVLIKMLVQAGPTMAAYLCGASLTHADCCMAPYLLHGWLSPSGGASESMQSD